MLCGSVRACLVVSAGVALSASKASERQARRPVADALADLGRTSSMFSKACSNISRVS
jgi:hypothetical protein